MIRSLSAPNKVDTSIGTLEFKDGAPSKKTVEKVRDTLDFTRALDRLAVSAGGARHRQELFRWRQDVQGDAA
jgi:hypothetical protein